MLPKSNEKDVCALNELLKFLECLSHLLTQQQAEKRRLTAE
jgi:hypothetical protein